MKTTWVQKVIGALLTILGALMSWALVEILDFKEAWYRDEAIEESQQFDNAEQKVRTIQHVETVDPSDIRVIQADLRHIIEEIHQNTDRLNRIEDIEKRTADQAYQTNRRLDSIGRND